MEFSTKLDSDELYCVKQQQQINSHIFVFVPLFVQFSISPMKISVADFSAPIGASDFTFCVHLQVG